MTKKDMLDFLRVQFLSVSDPELLETTGTLNWYITNVFEASTTLVDTQEINVGYRKNVKYYVADEGTDSESAYLDKDDAITIKASIIKNQAEATAIAASKIVA
jgi:hypothetical protein